VGLEPSDSYRLSSVGFAATSRGPAVLDDKLFIAILDGFLVALDLKSGAQRRSIQVLDYRLGYTMTMAPLAIQGKVVVGISGGEAGIRSFIDAYDAKTGTRAWRFWTIPGPGEPGHETLDWAVGRRVAAPTNAARLLRTACYSLSASNDSARLLRSLKDALAPSSSWLVGYSSITTGLDLSGAPMSR